LILIEDHPINPLVAKYVDRYQFFHIKDKGYFKTIPNGKIELYIVSAGAFRLWDEESEVFNTSQSFGFIPATSKVSLYEIPDHLICLNIKFNLNVLGLPFFEDFLMDWQSHSVADFIPPKEIQQLKSLITSGLKNLPINIIDRILNDPLEESNVNHEVVQLIELMEEYIHSDFRVTSLADRMNKSPKTLERLTKRKFNLTPKNLWQLIRFEQATSHIKRSNTSRLIESLAYGYYDQSHFIKECKKITGYSPKEFFSKLKLSTNDLIFENENDTNKK
jgi:AraC-like DNA-binding protein